MPGGGITRSRTQPAGPRSLQDRLLGADRVSVVPGPALLGATAYLYRLTAASHDAAFGLVAGLVALLAFGDALARATARWVIRRFLRPAEPVSEPG